MALTDISSVSEFDTFVKANPGKLCVVHFWAPWAEQCQQVNDVLLELSKTHAEVKFIKVEAESVPELSMKFEISAVPTCVLARNGAVVSRVNGANAPEITKKVTEAANLPPSEPTKQDLNSRIKSLLNKAPVMLFMKGRPEEPRCGFSRTIVGLLKDQGVRYDSFDILTDEEIRQGLKKYSNWPTYPQLYANGELVGGLDIIKELIESGEFKDQLPKQESLEERLQSLVKRDNVMLFMKGDPSTPRCGFSKTTVAIMQETGVKYGTFDILTDEEVRQGLKKFSDWPTYPQLYVNGELIGGLDIIKELKESGELVSTLSGSS